MNESELKTALEILKKERDKFNFVYARSAGMTVEGALKDAGRSKGWFYSLPREEQEHLEMLASELNANAKFKARAIMDDAIVEAAEVKVDGLRSRNENVKQSAATEILDRTFGKSAQPITGADGGAIVVKVVKGVTLDEL